MASCWGAWANKGCSIKYPGYHQYSSIIDPGPGTDPGFACEVTPAGNVCTSNSGALPPNAGNIQILFPGPNNKNYCENDIFNNTWGNIFVPDYNCGYVSPIDPNATPCNYDTDAYPYGPIRSDVYNSKFIKPGDAMVFIFPQWRGPTGTYTMLQGSGGSLLTRDNQLPVPGNSSLDQTFLFTVDVGSCPSRPSGYYVRYGDPITIRSIGVGGYIQCNAETPSPSGNYAPSDLYTCSLVGSPGNCSNSYWQTLYLVPGQDPYSGLPSSKKLGDPVCWNDYVYIAEFYAPNQYLTAAGYTEVWICPNGYCNNNYIIRLVPDSGSIYEDPTKELEAITNEQISTICDVNPFDWRCISQNLENFFQYFFYIIAGIVGFIVLIFVLDIIGAFRSAF